MKDFKTIIYEWVAENFGQSEADDPSWSIEALADRLSKSDIDPDELNANTKWLAYDKLREWNLEQDIDDVAESKGLTLTKEQVASVKRQYYKLDDATWEQLSMIMDNMKGEYNE